MKLSLPFQENRVVSSIMTRAVDKFSTGWVCSNWSKMPLYFGMSIVTALLAKSAFRS